MLPRRAESFCRGRFDTLQPLEGVKDPFAGFIIAGVVAFAPGVFCDGGSFDAFAFAVVPDFFDASAYFSVYIYEAHVVGVGVVGADLCVPLVALTGVDSVVDGVHCVRLSVRV